MRESIPSALPSLLPALLLRISALVHTHVVSVTTRSASDRSPDLAAATYFYLPVPLAPPGRSHLAALLLCTPTQPPPTSLHLRTLQTFEIRSALQTPADRSSRR